MQPVPEGYEPLNFVGFTDRGTYSDSMTYIKNDITHKDNTAWRCLIDDTVGITPSPDNEHWEVFVAATNDSSGITTTDILGILGNEGEKVSNQDLIDAIADRVINKLVEKAQMSGVQVNDENKIPTSALLYRMNNEISESLDELNGNLNTEQFRWNSPMKNGADIDNLPPGFWWINGYNTEHTGITPFTGFHYVILGRGTGNLCDEQIAIPATISDMIKVRHRDSTSGTWGTWLDSINLKAFGWGFISDLNEFKQFSGTPKLMFGHGSGYNNDSKNSPTAGAFVALYIPYGASSYGVQLVMTVQKVNGAYPIYKRTIENNTWSYWTDISCPCNHWDFDGTQDWDGYIAAGLYSIQCITGSHAPTGVGQWGYLEVLPWGETGSNGCLQRYYSTAGTAAYRIKYNGNWNAWHKLTS